jgi:hypothetical protein
MQVISTSWFLYLLSLLDNPDDWAISFFIDENKTKPEDIDLEIDGIVEMRLQVKIPFNAKNGTHRIIYDIYGSEKTSSSLSELSEIEIVTNVRLVSGIDLNVPEDISIDLGKTTKLQLQVHNQGNGLDTLNVSVFRDSVPLGWTVYFDAVKNTDSGSNVTKTVDFSAPIRVGYFEPTEYIPASSSKLDSISLILDANKIAYLRLSVTTPTTGKAVSYPITIYGESESGTISTVIKELSFKLRVSDIFLSNFKINPNLPIPGESVTAKVNVTNNFHLPANNFKVIFYKITDLGETELGSKVISNLPAGTSEMVEFKYEEDNDATDYILQAELTADFLPTSDKLFLKVSIGEKPEKKDDSGFANLRNGLIIAIIIALIVFLFIWLYGTKRKSTEGAPDPGSQRVSKKPKSSVDKLKEQKEKRKQKDESQTHNNDIEKVKSKGSGKPKKAKKRK